MKLNILPEVRGQAISYPGSTSEQIRLSVNEHLQSPEYVIQRRKDLDVIYTPMKQCVVCEVARYVSEPLKMVCIEQMINDRPSFYFVCHGCCVHKEGLALHALGLLSD